MLFGGELVAGEVLGLQSARTIRGHRFMGEAEFEISHADQYPALLLEKAKCKLIMKRGKRSSKLVLKRQHKTGRCRGSGRFTAGRSHLSGGMASDPDCEI